MPHLSTVARIQTSNVRSLVWHDDELVDWVSGGIRYSLDGKTVPRAVSYAYRFDSACASRSGEFAFIYEKLGTKGLLLQRGEIIREVDRSYYQANVFEFPVCFSELKDGREILIHCPDEYNRIEMEVAGTGERLSDSANRDPSDFFHSRLSVDSSNRYLMSAGWVWHPFDAVCVFDLNDAVDDPTNLDASQLLPMQPTEIGSAAFNHQCQIVTVTCDETFCDDDFEKNELRPNSIALWDLTQKQLIYQTGLSEKAGTIFSIEEEYVVDFFGHPKLISLRSGEVIDRLPEINSGEQTSSIIHHIESVPPLALDDRNKRFAIASEKEILVVKIEK